jgi:hypothetical protein
MQPGIYKVKELLDAAGVDFAQAEGDFRRIKIGGLGFDDLDKVIKLPKNGDDVSVTLDGEEIGLIEVEESN